jgi:NADH dehydrogenase
MSAFRTRVVIAGAGFAGLARKEVETDRGRLPYDYLVLAAGAVNNYFGHSEIAERSLGLNDLPEALHLRDTILAQFEAAAWITDPAEQARLLSFAVVGGGPTGGEFAGELAELVAATLTRDFPDLPRSGISITLADAGEHPLSALPRPLPAAAHQALERKGVGVRTGSWPTRSTRRACSSPTAPPSRPRSSSGPPGSAPTRATAA